MTATSTKQFDIIDWMARHGHPGYAAEINAIEAIKDEIRAEAGRYGDQCPFTQRALAREDKMIAEVIQAAQDRYDDWASD